MEQWSAKKLVLASMGVAVFSSALTGATVVWLLSGKKPAEQVFVPDAVSLPPSPGIHTAETPPQDPVQAGNWHYDHQRWAEAIQSYELALKSGIDNPDLRTDLGNCYRFSKRSEAALEQYQLAQKQNPQHEHSLFNQIALHSEDFKNPTRAAEIAREFIARFPKHPSVVAARKYLSE